MKENVFMSRERLAELQSEFQSGTRVETPDGHKGIVNFFYHGIDLCRVYYDTPGRITKSGEYKISECRMLTVDEAIGV